MPPTNDPKHRHSPKASHARRKSKPKFEIPVETRVRETTAGWVYRAEELPKLAPVPVAPKTSIDTSHSRPLLMAGMGLLFIGLGTVGLVSVVTLGMLAAPLRLARGLFAE